MCGVWSQRAKESVPPIDTTLPAFERRACCLIAGIFPKNSNYRSRASEAYGQESCVYSCNTHIVLQDWRQQAEHSMLPQSPLLKETDGAPWRHKKMPSLPTQFSGGVNVSRSQWWLLHDACVYVRVQGSPWRTRCCQCTPKPSKVWPCPRVNKKVAPVTIVEDQP